LAQACGSRENLLDFPIWEIDINFVRFVGTHKQYDYIDAKTI
jgi:mRNA-degrading endonuclease HigB of HigAB toxin-antitoxin module